MVNKRTVMGVIPRPQAEGSPLILRAILPRFARQDDGQRQCYKMFWVSIFLGTCFLVCGPINGWAAGEMITWEDCLKEVRQHNFELLAARAGLDQVKATKAMTRSSALPQISSSISADRGKTEGKAKTESYSYGVSGRQLLFDGFKTSNDLAAADENVKVAAYNYEVVSSDVRLELWTSFIKLLSAQEALKVTDDILLRRRQNLDLVTLQYKGGQQHKGSLLTAEANVAQAELDRKEADRNILLYQIRLAKALGRTTIMPIVAQGDLFVGDIDPNMPDWEKLVETTPLLKELTAKKEAARLGVKSARSDFFPQIYADAGAGKSDSSWLPETGNWSAGLSLTFPLFQGGQKTAALSKAKASFTQVDAQEKNGRSGVLMILAETWTLWQNSVDQVAVQEKFLEASRQRADIVEAQYKSGLATFNDWTIIEDDLVSKQKAILQAKTNALIAEASWRQAKGETVDE